jgi:hypothetical protein
MKHFNLSSLALLGCVAFLSMGCEVSDCSPQDEAKGICVQGESLTEFKGPEETQTVDWTPGMGLSVDGLNGEISIEQGVAGKVSAVFKPFSIRGASRVADARADMTHLVKTIDASTGTVNVRTSRMGEAGSALGGHIDVMIPPEFDSTIEIRNGNGDIEVVFVGNAFTLDARHEPNAAGSCRVTGGAMLNTATVHCAFDATVGGVQDNVTVTTENAGGDINLSIASVAADATGGNVTTKSGDIFLNMPAAGGYSVQATANKDGVVNEGTLPAGCNLQTAAANSKTVTCGTGPNFTVSAGTTSLLGQNVTLGYQ